MKEKSWLTVSIFAITCICLLVIYFLGLIESLELKSLDYRSQLFAKPNGASKKIAIVAIDEKSLRTFKNNNVVWKWPRDMYAALVRYLHRGGAELIVFDILFPDADIDRLSSYGEQTDNEFARAMKDAGNVILASHLLNAENLLTEDNPIVQQNQVTILPADKKNHFNRFSNAILPIEKFQNNATALGAANYKEDIDGVCRRASLFFAYQDATIPHLGLTAYLKLNGIDQIEYNSDKTIKVGNTDIPLDKKGHYLISWYGKGGPNGCFDYYSIGPLISSAVAEETGRKPILPSSHFQNKIVIIGSNAAALGDFRNTPFSTSGPYPGMEIYATMMSNFIQQDFLVRANQIVTILAIVVFSFLIFSAFLLISKVRTVLLISLFCALGWILTAFGLFSWHRIWLDLVAPEAAILVSFSVAAIVSYQTEGKARKHLRSIFGKYLSPVVISEIIEKNDKVELGGKELRATIYFSDIKGFTSISEQVQPNELVQLLNEYFTLSTNVILQHQGLLDKYIGDAIMALFGAPVPREDHSLSACHAALEVQQVLREQSQSNSGAKPDMITRIGINTGDVIVGNIGSNLRLDYTAIGDSVNLASRLEGVNKLFSTNIIISESTYADVRHVFLTRELDKLRVKGKNKPVHIYELIGMHNEVSDKKMERIDHFQRALRLYHQRDFRSARNAFQNIIKQFSDDTPSQIYLKRCDQFIETPPPDEWDGVYQMETK